MDELTIDDKTYISSKRAAQITGYAKDYVGQLCREGYVEARRVGRNWYVLEAAIRDHRFGTSAHSGAIASPATPVSKAWESPKYEPVEAAELPSINLLRKDVASGAEPAHIAERPKPSQDFHQAWQTWFDTFRTDGEQAQDPTELVLMPVEEAIQAQANPPTQDEPPIPVRLSIKDAPASAGPRMAHVAPTILETRIEDAIPRYAKRDKAHQRPGGALRATTAMILVVIAVACIGATILGTGYFDKKVISYKQAYIISGITYYKKI